MAIHERVLAAARAVCRDRPDWRFQLDEVVRALPELNASSVRTHVASRCCVNAPSHHAHRWPYFKRVGPGRYEIQRAYRETTKAAPASRVAEAKPAYAAPPLRRTLHAAITRSGTHLVGELLELPVVTQARTLDETVANLREAVHLHLEGEDRASLGLADDLELAISFQTSLG